MGDWIDVILAHPFLQAYGGAERTALEVAKHFNCPIYTIVYDKDKTFPEFKEFDIRILPKSSLEAPFFWLKNNPRHYNAMSGGFRYFSMKIKDDYDVLNPHGCPSEWIANNNERVCWLCHAPNREVFDLKEYRLKKMSLPKKAVSLAFGEIFKAVEFATIPKIKHIIANSDASQEKIKKYLNRDSTIIYPGVNMSEFYCTSYSKNFLCPSRIVPEKRFEYVIEAFRLFHKKHQDFKMLIAGNASDTKYLEKITSLIGNLPISIIPNPSETLMKHLYSDCYAVLFAGIAEDWGLVPIEAGASSKPIIAVNEGGCKYSIVHEQTGYLVDSPEKMAFWMATLAENPNMVETIGKAGHERVKNNYTWKIFMNKLEKKFSEVAKDG